MGCGVIGSHSDQARNILCSMTNWAGHAVAARFVTEY